MARHRSVRIICHTQILFRRQILFRNNVNGRRKRAIVSSTIAATFIFILRSPHRAMTDGGGAGPERLPILPGGYVSLLAENSDAKADHVDGATGPDWRSRGDGADG